jgi:hypothetical protein
LGKKYLEKGLGGEGCNVILVSVVLLVREWVREDGDSGVCRRLWL